MIRGRRTPQRLGIVRMAEGQDTGVLLSGENGWKWKVWVQRGSREGSTEVKVKGLPIRPS